MTTFAYDGKTFAGESQDTTSDTKRICGNKIVILEDWIVGGTGEWGRCDNIERWLEAGAKYEDREKYLSDYDEELSSGALVVSREDGSLYMINDYDLIFIPLESPNAIGSGEQAALGALFAGATAKEAVEIAKRIDPNSGGKVHTVDVDRYIK